MSRGLEPSDLGMPSTMRGAPTTTITLFRLVHVCIAKSGDTPVLMYPQPCPEGKVLRGSMSRMSQSIPAMVYKLINVSLVNDIHM